MGQVRRLRIRTVASQTLNPIASLHPMNWRPLGGQPTPPLSGSSPTRYGKVVLSQFGPRFASGRHRAAFRGLEVRSLKCRKFELARTGLRIRSAHRLLKGWAYRTGSTARHGPTRLTFLHGPRHALHEFRPPYLSRRRHREIGHDDHRLRKLVIGDAPFEKRHNLAQLQRRPRL